MTLCAYTSSLAGLRTLQKTYEGRRVLVAGASGFLGVNCVRALESLGAATTVVSRTGRPPHESYNGRIVHGDLKDRSVAEAAVRDQSIVLDCLGYPQLSPTHLEPSGDLEDEFRPHLNLFYAAADSPSPPLLIHCSTRLVYGAPERLPVDESHPLRPRSVYAVHKLAMETHLCALREMGRLDSIIVRLSNPYGPNGSSLSVRMGVWNRFIRAAAAREPITVYGEGNQLRDFIYVDDVVRALLLLGDREACRNEVFNLGGDRSIPVRQAVEIIARAAGAAPVRTSPWPADAKVVETGDYRTDLSKLRRYIPLGPLTPFEQGVSLTLQSLRREATSASIGGSVADHSPAADVPVASPQGDDLHGRRVLITGASGFIGGRLVRRFQAEGAKVTAMARASDRLERLAGETGCETIACDLCDRRATIDAVKALAPQIILHFASAPDGAETVEGAHARLASNTVGALHLLEGCKNESETVFIYGDSCKVYGNGPVPHRGSNPTDPNSSYGISKAAAWALCRLYSRLYKIAVVSLRPSLIYGPGQGPNLISVVMDAALRGDPTVHLQGGEQTREPLFIDDAVAACVASARLGRQLNGRAITLGGGREISVHDLAQMVVEAVGAETRVICEQRDLRPTEVLRSVSDLDEARRLLGWRPRVSLREGLEQTVASRLKPVIVSDVSGAETNP